MTPQRSQDYCIGHIKVNVAFSHYDSAHNFQHCLIKITWPWLSQYFEGDNIFRHDILLQQRVQLQELFNGFCKAIALQLEEKENNRQPKYEKAAFIGILFFINICVLELNSILRVLMVENWVLWQWKLLFLMIYVMVNTLHLFYLRLFFKRETKTILICVFFPMLRCEVSLARIICQYLETE